MSAPDLDVRYIAQLARLHLSEEEVMTFQGQLSQVLAYVDTLQQLETSGVEPTAHANPVYNVFRSDEPRDFFTPEEALKNSPRQGNELFIVTKVVD